MPSASAVALFAVAALVLLVIPGPSVLYVVSRSVEHGRTAGLVAVAGIHVGTLVHVAAATLGISAILVSSATAFSVVKYAGAVYLVILGVRRITSRDPVFELGPDRSRAPLGRVMRQGVVVNVLNPKTALFFFAFLPQFVDPSHGAPLQIATLGLVFVALGLVSDSAWAVSAGAAAGWLRRRPAILRRERYLTGALFIGLGVVTAFAGSERKSV